MLTLVKELLNSSKSADKVCALCEAHTTFCQYAEVYGFWGWHCPECVDWGKSNESVFSSDDDWQPQYSTTGATTKPQVSVPSCSHNLTPLQLPDGHTIYLSGSSHLKSKAKGPLPTAAVYLDEGWTDGQVLSNDGTVTAAANEIATLVIQWSDFRAIEQGALMQAVKWAQCKLDAGELLEVGCLAGHGRTGSFAVAMCITQGLLAADAILYVKAYYCIKAVETGVQREMLTLLDKGINGT